MATITQRDIGVEFRRTIKDQNGRPVRLEQASTVTMLIEKPNGAVLSNAASFPNGGSDGVAQWINSASTDFDFVGEYSWWVEVAYASGSVFTTEAASFLVRNRPEVS